MLLPLFWSVQKWFYPFLLTPWDSLIVFLNFQLNWVTANSKIGSENCVSADPEINSENCLAADPEIGSQNRVVADSEIGSEKLRRYRFTNQLPKLHRCGFGNRQPETVSLPIRKSATRNCVAADSEIGSQKLCHCQFKNQQRWWSHFSFTSLFFCVFTLCDKAASWNSRGGFKFNHKVMVIRFKSCHLVLWSLKDLKVYESLGKGTSCVNPEKIKVGLN